MRQHSARQLQDINAISANHLCLVTDALFKPSITISPSINWVSEEQQREQKVFRGSSFTVSCSIQPQYAGGSFQVTFTGPKHTQPDVHLSDNIQSPDSEDDQTHQGNNSSFNTTQNNTPPSDYDSDYSLTPEEDLTYEEDQSSINTTQSPILPAANHSDSVLFPEEDHAHQGNNSVYNATHTHIQEAVNHSADFLFPVADHHTHQGNYSCVYHVSVSNQSFSSESELLSLDVIGRLNYTFKAILCNSPDCRSVVVLQVFPVL